MARLCTPVHFMSIGSLNHKVWNQTNLVTLKRCKEKLFFESASYSTERKISKQADLEEKKRKFEELEKEWQKKLDIDQLTTQEKQIHCFHAEAVAKGHFTYDDPWLNEKVLTRLRHFLKGKCCGKSCRHCIYDHSAVVDEKMKAKARFNSSFWVYDGEEEEESINFDEQHVVTYGRGPYPRKYAQNAPQSMIKIPSKPKEISR